MSEGETQALSVSEVVAEKTDYQVWTDAVKESFGPLTNEGLAKRDGDFAAEVEGRKGEVEGFIQKLLDGGADTGGGGEADSVPPFDLKAIEKIVFDRTVGEQLDEGEKRLFNSLKVSVAALNGITRGDPNLYDQVYNDEKHKPEIADFIVRMAAAGVMAREAMVKNFPGFQGMLVDFGMGEALRTGAAAEAPRRIDPGQAKASGKILASGRDLSVFTRGEIFRFSDKFLETTNEKIKARIGNELTPNLVAGVGLEHGRVDALDSIPVLKNLRNLQ
ncbi:MAG: hypothetical protein HY602_03230 [Parcubacteria group bacterium]|nr:hypothetical protein [Parcubacteria group bacterium]